MYADASPITGAEIYGCLMDLFTEMGGAVLIQHLFPGSVLGQGYTDTASKIMALLWCIFLVTGPHLKFIELFLEDVRSLTTDCGVEHYLSNYSNCIKCLLQGHILDAGMPARHYKAILDEQPQPIENPMLALPPQEQMEVPLAIEDADSDEILDAGLPPAADVPQSLAPVPRDAQPCSSASTSSDLSSSSGSSSEVLEAERIPDGRAPTIPDYIGGGRLQWEDRRSRSGYCRYVLTCAHHPQCVKKRNAMAGQCRNYGVYEPQAYLAV